MWRKRMEQRRVAGGLRTHEDEDLLLEEVLEVLNADLAVVIRIYRRRDTKSKRNERTNSVR